MRFKWKVPTTMFFPFTECLRHPALATGKALGGPDAKVTFSYMSTADALLSLSASDRSRRICALNFANGVQVGGGYKTGAKAQEEDLCRRLPNLYTSLMNAKRDGFYPFGPSTWLSKEDCGKYSDVLFTSGVVVARLGEDKDFVLLPPEQQVQVCIVTAAAPNINFASEVYDLELMHDTIKAVFVAPKIVAPETTTLILGAWGCGAFGGDPHDISGLFAKALSTDMLGRLYKEVHFAVPRYDPADINSEVFKTTLKKSGIQFTEM